MQGSRLRSDANEYSQVPPSICFPGLALWQPQVPSRKRRLRAPARVRLARRAGHSVRYSQARTHGEDLRNLCTCILALLFLFAGGTHIVRPSLFCETILSFPGGVTCDVWRGWKKLFSVHVEEAYRSPRWSSNLKRDGLAASYLAACIRQPGFGHPVRHIPPHPTPATPSRAIDVLCCAVLADTHTLSWYFVKTFVRSIRCRQSSAGRVKQESAMLAAVSTRP